MERSYVNIKDLENEPEKMIVCRKNIISYSVSLYSMCDLGYKVCFQEIKKKIVGKVSIKKRFVSHLKRGV